MIKFRSAHDAGWRLDDLARPVAKASATFWQNMRAVTPMLEGIDHYAIKEASPEMLPLLQQGLEIVACVLQDMRCVQRGAFERRLCMALVHETLNRYCHIIHRLGKPVPRLVEHRRLARRARTTAEDAIDEVTQ